ncbi:MAG: hypothetical protein KME18_15065 [Phormidium tanganyikae FI6-MK23]|jgi:hypothetical protein|nr:hypothetical protein [Phormidium tanganyikae FI6-MK23]
MLIAKRASTIAVLELDFTIAFLDSGILKLDFALMFLNSTILKLDFMIAFLDSRILKLDFAIAFEENYSSSSNKGKFRSISTSAVKLRR